MLKFIISRAYRPLVLYMCAGIVIALASAATSRAKLESPCPAGPFELLSRDGLRHVVFGLDKDPNDSKSNWRISFKLFEREKKSEPWGAVIDAGSIEVDHELDAQAQRTARGMTALQQSYALGPAANAVKAAHAGRLTQEKANRTIIETLRKL